MKKIKQTGIIFLTAATICSGCSASSVNSKSVSKKAKNTDYYVEQAEKKEQNHWMQTLYFSASRQAEKYADFEAQVQYQSNSQRMANAESMYQIWDQAVKNTDNEIKKNISSEDYRKLDAKEKEWEEKQTVAIKQIQSSDHEKLTKEYLYLAFAHKMHTKWLIETYLLSKKTDLYNKVEEDDFNQILDKTSLYWSWFYEAVEKGKQSSMPVISDWTKTVISCSNLTMGYASRISKEDMQKEQRQIYTGKAVAAKPKTDFFPENAFLEENGEYVDHATGIYLKKVYMIYGIEDISFVEDRCMITVNIYFFPDSQNIKVTKASKIRFLLAPAKTKAKYKIMKMQVVRDYLNRTKTKKRHKNVTKK